MPLSELPADSVLFYAQVSECPSPLISSVSIFSGGWGQRPLQYRLYFSVSVHNYRERKSGEGGRWRDTRTSGDSGWILDVSRKIRRWGVSGLPEVSQGLHPELDKCPDG